MWRLSSTLSRQGNILWLCAKEEIAAAQSGARSRAQAPIGAGASAAKHHYFPTEPVLSGT